LKIIALQGKGNSGKTTSIKILDNILLNNNYTPVPNMRQTHGKDFLDIYVHSISKLKVGITSSGDTYDLVKNRLQDLVNAKCDICICACRTFDRNPPGTVAATKSFINYTNIYLPKTFSLTNTQELNDNVSDAMKLFNLI
jgi:hypothetical protein